MAEVLDLRRVLDIDLKSGRVMSTGMLRHHWQAEGSPRDVGVSLEQAQMLEQIYAPVHFVPLNSDTFQLPFLRLHVIGRDG